jgi:hypothetical protein
MSIQSKSARILAVVSVLALASACGEGAEGAEQQASPAQIAPDSLKGQEAAIDPDNYSNCTVDCRLDFWGTDSNGMAAGWACVTTLPNTFMPVVIYKWNGYGWQEIGRGTADVYNAGLSSVCGGSPYHQFSIYIGPWNAGPGKYQIVARPSPYSDYEAIVRTFYK